MKEQARRRAQATEPTMNGGLIGIALVVAAVVLLIVPGGAGAAQSPGRGYEQVGEVLLQLEHPAGLKKLARRISTPTSRRYRRYRSPRKLIRRFGASRKTRRAAASWLRERGFEVEVAPTHDWIAASGPVEAIGGERARSAAAAGEDTALPVPAGLRGAVTGVQLIGRRAPQQLRSPSPRAQPQPRASFEPSPPSSARARTGTPAGCEAGRNAAPAPYQPFTPNQYTRAYGHTAMHEAGYTGRGQRVALLEVDKAPRGDLETWAECFGIDPPRVKTHFLLGPRRSVDVLGETNLDLQVLAASAPGLKRIDVYTVPTDATSFAEPLVFQLAAAITARRTPDVISASLGVCEARQSTSYVFVRAVNNALALAAAAGITTLFASQDTGSATCRTERAALPILSPSFPGTSPYTTSVGGTNFELDRRNRIVEQITWNDKPDFVAASGGGSSGLFGRPWFQRGVPPHVGRTGKGRQVPDIAALGDAVPGYSVYCSSPGCGQVGYSPVGGTSAATPLIAGGVALVNEASERRGEPNLGLLNPLLYEVGTGKRPGRLFDDVVVGNNEVGTAIPEEMGGGAPLGCCFAHEGYDRATGWGSPDIVGLDRIARRYAP